jgi:phosphoribosylanthranilate isomerase
VDAGADAVGFVFRVGPRGVTPARAAKIARTLPPFVSRVGVFVNETSSFVRKAAAACGLSWAQLHGDETPEYARALGVPWVRVFTSLEGIRRFRVDAFQLDASVPGRRGGTGTAVNRGLARRAARMGRLILSGGLSPGNVRDTVRDVPCRPAWSGALGRRTPRR